MIVGKALYSFRPKVKALLKDIVTADVDKMVTINKVFHTCLSKCLAFSIRNSIMIRSFLPKRAKN